MGIARSEATEQQGKGNLPQRHKRVKWSKREKERQAKGEKKTEAEKGFGFVETKAQSLWSE